MNAGRRGDEACVEAEPECLYGLRPARIGDIPRLQEIEDVAGRMPYGLGLIDESLDASFPTGRLQHLVQRGQAWVACTHAGEMVGFLLVSEREGRAYIEEMDVLPEHGRRGIGTKLIERVAEWAVRAGLPRLTLSTFRDVSWNAPFYAKRGFRVVPSPDWSEGMRAIRAHEAQHGLTVEARVTLP
ncbi:MAG: GNAT family N-acetyltransferase [Proteobacteria bacterium]|uniref:GNAT family N-acetyltransferase n=1 Tax=Rudaea sp. TaxID=2136325 RepID=UPI00321FF4EB|nr:GNAT family N-acetyltransferase [Pseudomonadota bacterium]